MNDSFSQRIMPRTAHCDLSGHVNLHSLFLWMQEIAGDDSDRLGMGRQFMEENNIFWVLSRLQIKLLRPLCCDHEVVLRTWHGDAIRYIFPRYFSLETPGGETLAQASSLWMLIDRSTRQIVMPSIRGLSLPPASATMPAYPAPGKILADVPLPQCTERMPLYSDFDINGHMNNARYPLWICDLFPPSQYQREYISQIHINYLHEILEGESVSLQHGRVEDCFRVQGLVDGQTRFEATGQFSTLE